MIRAGWVTVKQHRVEVAIAIAVALLGTAWAVWVEVRAAGVNVPPECFAVWIAAGRDGAGACFGPIRAWGIVLGDAGDNFRQFNQFMPFVVGALVGVPIVAGEIEGRTASMAWSLSPSRIRWLIRQVVPVALVTGIALAVAAVAAGVIERDQETWGGGYRDVTHISHYGYGLVARAFGAFGIALGLGALLGRQLPSFLLALPLALGFLTGLTEVRNAWFASHAVHAFETRVLPNGEVEQLEYGVATDWAWRTPDGAVISKEEATALVPPELVAQDEGMVQLMNVAVWLEERGYRQVSIGISTDVAFGWAPLEAGAYVLLGLGSIAAGAWLVNRRRPT